MLKRYQVSERQVGAEETLLSRKALSPFLGSQKSRKKQVTLILIIYVI